MLFDWYTVCAQLLNFLLLVWLLKRFLYRPILDAIDAREKLIAGQLQDAEQQKAAAQEERKEFQSKNESFDRQRDSLLKAATADAQRERLRLLDAARAEADALRAVFTEKIGRERQAWQREMIQRTQREVFAIARRTLEDLANANLEDQITNVLVRRLKELDPAEKAKLRAFSQTAASPVLIRGAFELGSTQRDLIQSALTETLGMQVAPRFETNPDLVCGIELLLNGHKLAWSIADYLATVEHRLGDLLPEPSASNLEQHAATATV